MMPLVLSREELAPWIRTTDKYLGLVGSMERLLGVMTITRGAIFLLVASYCITAYCNCMALSSGLLHLLEMEKKLSAPNMSCYCCPPWYYLLLVLDLQAPQSHHVQWRC
jgi:hypothetical protein